MARARRDHHSELPIHITARTNHRLAFPIPLDEAWSIFSDHLFLLRALFKVRILSFVMMPNHFHIIVRDPHGEISNAMAYFMRETSKEIGRKAHKPGLLWGSRYHSSVIANPIYFFNAYKYVYRNPVRARIVDSPFAYRYSTLHALVGLAHTIIPIEPDETLFENFESTLAWLERSPSETMNQAIRGGLRRQTFCPSRDERTKRPQRLEFEQESGK